MKLYLRLFGGENVDHNSYSRPTKHRFFLVYAPPPTHTYIHTRKVGLLVSVSASHSVGRGFAPRPGHTKKMVQPASLIGTHALG